MITSERISAYLRSLVRPKSVFTETLRKEAIASGVPVIREEEEPLLQFFAELLKPEEVLEVGTAIGYSALLFAEALPEGSRITTIENDPGRIESARANFERAGQSERIRLIPGDAGEVLKTLPGPYRLIFLDAAKAQYQLWLPELLRLLPEGGVLIADNVFQDGDVLESGYLVERRDRTIHKRMRAFLSEITGRDDLQTAVLPIGDGVSVTLKNEAAAKKESPGIPAPMKDRLPDSK